MLGVGGGAAMMTFHRPGAWAVNFGLDTDNQLKVGGWSMGANAYTLWHSGNFTPSNYQTNLGYTPVNRAGDTMTGNLAFSAANPTITSGGSYITIPNGLYVSGGTPYFQTQIQARGGIRNDNAGTLQIDGGTSNITHFPGSVGIGTAAPNAKLEVSGGAINSVAQAPAAASVNLSTGNTHVLTTPGTNSIALSGMVHGGQYTIVIRDTTSRTYAFTGCTSTHWSPASGATSNRSIFGILTLNVSGNWECYITWQTGFNN
jgi:hypothetical protein